MVAFVESLKSEAILNSNRPAVTLCGSRGDNEYAAQDSVITVGREMNIWDPFSLKEIRIPVRGKNCTHLSVSITLLSSLHLLPA